MKLKKEVAVLEILSIAPSFPFVKGGLVSVELEPGWAQVYPGGDIRKGDYVDITDTARLTHIPKACVGPGCEYEEVVE